MRCLRTAVVSLALVASLAHTSTAVTLGAAIDELAPSQMPALAGVPSHVLAALADVPRADRPRLSPGEHDRLRASLAMLAVAQDALPLIPAESARLALALEFQVVDARMADLARTDAASSAALERYHDAMVSAVEIMAGSDGPSNPCFSNLFDCFEYCSYRVEGALQRFGCALDCELDFIDCAGGDDDEGGGKPTDGEPSKAPPTGTDFTP